MSQQKNSPQIVLCMLLSTPQGSSGTLAAGILKIYSTGVSGIFRIMRILFYQKKYIKAKALLEVMRKNFPDDMEPLRKARINFFLASVFFRQGEIKKAKTLISVNTELMKDKSGWAVSIRMLELMLLAEQHNKEECIGKAKQLQRFLKYNPAASKRDVLMAELFFKWAQRDSKNPKSLKGLLGKQNPTAPFRAGGKDYAWDAMSHEIIRYDTWIGKFMKKPQLTAR